MRYRYPVMAFTATLGLVIFQAQAQTPPPNADPYANNPDAGKLQFPLAAAEYVKQFGSEAAAGRPVR